MEKTKQIKSYIDFTIRELKELGEKAKKQLNDDRLSQTEKMQVMIKFSRYIGRLHELNIIKSMI